VANNGAGCAYQPAADMMQLTWDDDLRQTARELLNKKSKIHFLLKCKFYMFGSTIFNFLFFKIIFSYFLFFWRGGIDFFFSYYIQHCFICGLSDSTVPTDAGIEPRTVATDAFAVRRSNH
jgi:hypothetical protein